MHKRVQSVSNSNTPAGSIWTEAWRNCREFWGAQQAYAVVTCTSSEFLDLSWNVFEDSTDFSMEVSLGCSDIGPCVHLSSMTTLAYTIGVLRNVCSCHWRSVQSRVDFATTHLSTTHASYRVQGGQSFQFTCSLQANTAVTSNAMLDSCVCRVCSCESTRAMRTACTCCDDCTVLYCAVLYCTVLYCTVLYCTVLYYSVLYYNVLY